MVTCGERLRVWWSKFDSSNTKQAFFTAVKSWTLVRNTLSYLQSGDDQLLLQRLWAPHAAASTLRCLLSLAAAPSTFCACVRTSPSPWGLRYETSCMRKSRLSIKMTDRSAANALRKSQNNLSQCISCIQSYLYAFKAINKTPWKHLFSEYHHFLQYQGVSINILLFEKFRSLLQKAETSVSVTEFLSGWSKNMVFLNAKVFINTGQKRSGIDGAAML